MKNKKEKLFIHGIANIVIVGVLALFAVMTLSYNSITVFGNNSYSPIYNGNRDSNKVSLMINSYWGT